MLPKGGMFKVDDLGFLGYFVLFETREAYLTAGWPGEKVENLVLDGHVGLAGSSLASGCR